ncbi:unnamed protein product [Owenia fusiformis]|uniref:DUF3419 family protein n=1 Tax=Owenia fusiformis TaxID=6347 RepID=A0A8S4NNY1_OWEFU|nr:unnamed protein product [Owenia fusiformis]
MSILRYTNKFLAGNIFGRALRHVACRTYSEGEEVPPVHLGQNERILFSMSLEDIRSIRHGLEIKSGDRVFTLASGGGNAITLLLDDPAEVVALDFSIPQLHLAKLQSACIKYLSYQEFIDFVGVKNMEPEERVRIFNSIKGALEADVREYWNANTSDINQGIINCGDFEHRFKIFAENAMNVALSPNQMETFLSMGDDMNEQRRYFKDVIDGEVFRRAYRRLGYWTFKGTNTDIMPALDYPNIFLQHFLNKVKTTPMNQSYFMEFIFTWKHGVLTPLREYLQEENFDVLKDRIGRMKWLHGEMMNYFKTFPTLNQPKFDAMGLSNVTDLMTLSNHNTTLRAAAKVVKQHGNILFLCVKGLPKTWPEDLVGSAVVIEHDKVKECSEMDRAFFWEDIQVAKVL